MFIAICAGFKYKKHTDSEGAWLLASCSARYSRNQLEKVASVMHYNLRSPYAASVVPGFYYDTNKPTNSTILQVIFRRAFVSVLAKFCTCAENAISEVRGEVLSSLSDLAIRVS